MTHNIIPTQYRPRTMRIFLFATLLFTAFVAGSCKKCSDIQPESHIPKESQTGAYVVYFKIDGKDYPGTYSAWAAQEEFGDHTRMRLDFTSAQKSQTKSFVLDCDSVRGKGIYKVGLNRGEFAPYVVDRSRTCLFFDDLRKGNCSGWVKVTRADTKDRICSGTFEFKVWTDDVSCDTIRITNGVFDIRE